MTPDSKGKRLKKKSKKLPQDLIGKQVTVGEEIIIPNWDSSNLSEEKMEILSELFSRKARQDELRREHQQRWILHDIKDIFLDTIIVDDLDEKDPIIELLLNFNSC